MRLICFPAFDSLTGVSFAGSSTLRPLIYKLGEQKQQNIAARKSAEGGDAPGLTEGDHSQPTGKPHRMQQGKEPPRGSKPAHGRRGSVFIVFSSLPVCRRCRRKHCDTGLALFFFFLSLLQTAAGKIRPHCPPAARSEPPVAALRRGRSTRESYLISVTYTGNVMRNCYEGDGAGDAALVGGP